MPRIAFLLLLMGCSEGSQLADQLRGLTVRVDDENVLHGTIPVEGSATALGAVPRIQDDYLSGGRRRLVFSGTVFDWQAELVGDDEAFTFLITQDGWLSGLWCLPPALDDYEADLVITADSQPGREFRVGFSCEGSDLSRRLLIHADEVGPSGMVAGRLADGQLQGELAVQRPGDELPVVVPGLAGALVARRGVLADGRVVVRHEGSFVLVEADLSHRTIGSASGDLFGLMASPAGDAVWYYDRDVVYRLALDGSEPDVFRVASGVPDLAWVSQSGALALTSTGPVLGPWVAHTIDAATGDVAVVSVGGSESLDAQVAAISDDLHTLVQLRSYFGDVRLWVTDLVTGDRRDLAERAVADLQARRVGGVNNVTDLSITPDLAYAALVFDNVQADPVGFVLRGSFVYVVELATGRTWLASTDPSGDAIRFDPGLTTGRLLEHVRISPDGNTLLFGRDYLTERAAWVEVP